MTNHVTLLGDGCEGADLIWATLRATRFHASHGANLRCLRPSGFNRAQGGGA